MKPPKENKRKKVRKSKHKEVRERFFPSTHHPSPSNLQFCSRTSLIICLDLVIAPNDASIARWFARRDVATSFAPRAIHWCLWRSLLLMAGIPLRLSISSGSRRCRNGLNYSILWLPVPSICGAGGPTLESAILGIWPLLLGAWVMGAGMSGVLSRRDLIVISGGAPRFMSDRYVGSIPWVGVFRDNVPGVNETGELW